MAQLLIGFIVNEFIKEVTGSSEVETGLSELELLKHCDELYGCT